ncbi:tripartite motif containing 105 isoform X2 [Coregonus clupeaformis]|uniref:tripartite motif containing 105 isoform X2 n=1 Tax=Coregonus clupeaformis TaxID=59861 RepID=UPI001BE0D462|nr:tripartite motif containing 105 isoform X2 [Coregonus clupeaformis]
MSAVAPNSKSQSSLREDLTCAICCDLFTEPVMLGCMHHFCKPCISTYWRGTQTPVSCPQCRKEFTTKQFQTNYLVTAMVEKVRASTSDCFVKNIEKQLKESLEAHRQRREDFITALHRDQDKIESIKRIGSELQARVQGEFQALQAFLAEEEACVLEQLRREQEEAVEQLQRHLEAVREAVRRLEHSMRVLQEAATPTHQTGLVELPQLRTPLEVDPGPELDLDGFGSRYTAPLQYITWRKMFRSLKPGLAPVTFDVDTAHPSVYVSRDRTVAVDCDGMVPYPSNPKRFLQCVNVLGAQGFQAGRHYWEVGVGSKAKWDLGVASERVDRQARVKLSPESGYWTLRLREGDQYSAGTQPWTRLQVGWSPQRIGVFLDCDERKVSFYNADDMSLLYTFSNGPRGRVLPFFSPCVSDTNQKPQPIQLLHYPPVDLTY